MIENPRLKLTIVYDNNPCDERLQTDWGFSCFISGPEKSILFDTGGKGRILLENMDMLGIHPSEIDLVFLSHTHKDHTGGLMALLEKNNKLEVLVPDFFPSSFKDSIQSIGGTVVESNSFQKICEGAFTTGPIKGWIKEQALILESRKGLILITGCAHPRIVNIIATVKQLTQKNIYLVLGGIHLSGFPNREIDAIISEFRNQDIKQVAPTHCSGERTRLLFAEEYQDNFIKAGVGKVINIQ